MYDFRSLVETIQQTQKEQYTEGVEDNMNDLSNEFIKVFQKHFRKSYIGSKFTTNLSSGIMIRITLGENKSEYNNGIVQNDPMFTHFSVYPVNRSAVDKDGIYSGDLVMERFQGAGLRVISSNPMFAYETVKVQFRKTTGDTKKLLKAFENHIIKLKEAVKNNTERLDLPFDPKTKI